MKSIFVIFTILNIGPCLAQPRIEMLPINSSTPLKALSLEENILPEDSLAICKQLTKELAVVKVRYWGYDDKEHVGALIVHESLGSEVIEIFQALFEYRFPIQGMDPIFSTQKDDAAMSNNLTGSFNCREVTAQPGIMSQHSYGRAIDINPMINPYVKDKLVVPNGAEKHIDRNLPEKGKICANSVVTELFAKYGWDWGGNWFDMQDYQHFEKRANGEKRNPYGYPKVTKG